MKYEIELSVDYGAVICPHEYETPFISVSSLVPVLTAFSVSLSVTDTAFSWL